MRAQISSWNSAHQWFLGRVCWLPSLPLFPMVARGMAVRSGHHPGSPLPWDPSSSSSPRQPAHQARPPSNLPCGHGPSLSGDDHVFSLPFVSGMRWLTWLGFHTLNHSCVHGIHSTQSYCIILFHVLVELVCWNLDEEIRVCIQRSYGGPFLWCLWF